MTQYLLSIAGAVVAGEVIINLLPEGELRKYVKVIVFVVASMIIFSPVVSFLTGGEAERLLDFEYAAQVYYEDGGIDIYKQYAQDIAERNGGYHE